MSDNSSFKRLLFELTGPVHQERSVCLLFLDVFGHVLILLKFYNSDWLLQSKE